MYFSSTCPTSMYRLELPRIKTIFANNIDDEPTPPPPPLHLPTPNDINRYYYRRKIVVLFSNVNIYFSMINKSINNATKRKRRPTLKKRLSQTTINVDSVTAEIGYRKNTITNSKAFESNNLMVFDQVVHNICHRQKATFSTWNRRSKGSRAQVANSKQDRWLHRQTKDDDKEIIESCHWAIKWWYGYDQSWYGERHFPSSMSVVAHVINHYLDNKLVNNRDEHRSLAQIHRHCRQSSTISHSTR